MELCHCDGNFTAASIELNHCWQVSLRHITLEGRGETGMLTLNYCTQMTMDNIAPAGVDIYYLCGESETDLQATPLQFAQANTFSADFDKVKPTQQQARKSYSIEGGTKTLWVERRQEGNGVVLNSCTDCEIAFTVRSWNGQYSFTPNANDRFLSVDEHCQRITVQPLHLGTPGMKAKDKDGKTVYQPDVKKEIRLLGKDNVVRGTANWKHPMKHEHIFTPFVLCSQPTPVLTDRSCKTS